MSPDPLPSRNPDVPKEERSDEIAGSDQSSGSMRNARIGKYEVISHIASGGMGAVYRARDTETQQVVALKVLSPEYARSPALLERFRREARHTGKLDHPNIVARYDHGEAGGRYFIAMEYVDGIDLDEYVERKGPLDLVEARRIIRQACRALQHVYSKNIVHRDIKPSNFLLATHKGKRIVKLIDMGLALEHDTDDFRVTRAGTTVGTLDYMAPEQARDSGSADIRSDLYSLGATWYFLLTGHPPFPKGGLAERLLRIMNEEPREIRELNPTVSEANSFIIHRLMSKKPDDRYQTPGALLEDVAALSKTDDANQLPSLCELEKTATELPAQPPSDGELLEGARLTLRRPLETRSEDTRPPPGDRDTQIPQREKAFHLKRSTEKEPRRKQDPENSGGGGGGPHPGPRPKSTRKSQPAVAKDPPRKVNNQLLWVGLAGGAALLSMTVLILALTLPRGPTAQNAHALNQQGPPETGEPRGGSVLLIPQTPPAGLKPSSPSRLSQPTLSKVPYPVSPPTKGTTQVKGWPQLYQPSTPIPTAKLRKEVEAPFVGQRAQPEDAVTLRIARLPSKGGLSRGALASSPARSDVKEYQSLPEAIGALSPEQNAIIEIHDNGPLFFTSTTVSNRDILLRPGKGYHPLIIWDVEQSVARAKGPEGKAPKGANLAKFPSTMLSLRGGSLAIEDLEIAVRWPDEGMEKRTAQPALFHVASGHLTLTNVTFSAGGKHSDGITLARLEGLWGSVPLTDRKEREDRKGTHPSSRKLPQPALCRMTHCHARGASLIALNVVAPGTRDPEKTSANIHVLLEGCLFVGKDQPLLQVQGAPKNQTTLHVVGSTLITGSDLLTVAPVGIRELSPRIRWLGWDSLLSRSASTAGGTLLHVGGNTSTQHMSWRAYNCLYAGWKNLLASGSSLPHEETISGRNWSRWRVRWQRTEGDVGVPNPWPLRPVAEPDQVAPARYSTERTPVAFASSVDPGKPGGCDLSALPRSISDWRFLSYQRRALAPVQSITDSTPPDITARGGRTVFHGESVNLDEVDLGAYLKKIQTLPNLGPKGKRKITLHLRGKGVHTMTPVRLEGIHLVLFFDQDKDEPLILQPARGGTGSALVDVHRGNLDVIQGRFALQATHGLQWLFRVQGGNLRMHRCHLRAPVRPHRHHKGLISFRGKGEKATHRKPHTSTTGEPRGLAPPPPPGDQDQYILSAHQCVLVSGGKLFRVEDTFARVVVQRSLLVTGSVACVLAPGERARAAKRTRAATQFTLERSTVAVKQAVVHLSKVPFTVLRASLRPPGKSSSSGAGSLVNRERRPDPVLVQTRGCAFLDPFGVASLAGLLIVDRQTLRQGLLVWQSKDDLYDARLRFAVALPGTTPPRIPPKPVLTSWKELWGSRNVVDPVPQVYLARVSLGRTTWKLEKLRLPPIRGKGFSFRQVGADLRTLGIGK